VIRRINLGFRIDSKKQADELIAAGFQKMEKGEISGNVKLVVSLSETPAM